MTYPSNVPVGAQYWKVIGGTWTDVTSLLGDDDGDNILTLTITDGGLGDADFMADGEINDPGGVGFVSTSTITSPSTIPGAPTGLSATALSSSEINLSWTAPSGTITGYMIHRDGVMIVDDTASTDTTYSDTGLESGTTYTYVVIAINSVGTGLESNEASATTDAATTPTSLTATIISDSQINLSWTAPDGTIKGYKIEQSISDGQWKTVKSTTTTSTAYNNLKLKPNTEYNYRVSAIFASSTSDPSDEFLTFTLPKAPTKLAGKVISSSQINLSWKAPTGSAAGYKIEQKTGTGDFETIVDDTGNTSVTYSVTGLAEKTSYTYRVSAVNAAGSSVPSNSASATTDAEPVENLLRLTATGTATLKAVTTGTNLFAAGDYTVTILITADDSVNTRGVPTLSNIAGTFSIDGVGDSQDVADQPLTIKKLTVSKDRKSIQWTANEGSGVFKFASTVDFTGTGQDGSTSTISKLKIGKATFTPKVSASSIDFS
jgi:hypothetical protein